MGALAEFAWELCTDNGEGVQISRPRKLKRWSITATEVGERDTVSLTALAFTALSPPSGAKACCLVLGTAVSLTLKGVTGDTGIELVPSSNPLGIDAIFPLGSSPSIGIANGSALAQTIEVIWL